MSRAFIFPGQGSQTIGMGKDFFESEIVAKEVFQKVDETLKRNLSEIIFNGTSEELADTTNTQPAIMTTSIAILKTLLNKTDKKIDELCSVVAGHSLGEYSALCASDFMTLNQTAALLDIRSNAMKKSSPLGVGGMAACIGIDAKKLQTVIDQSIATGICQIANDNTKGQIVISGHVENIDIMVRQLKSQKYKAIKLNVSAAFHSDLMKDAEIIMQNALLNQKFNHSKLPIISNYTAVIEQEIDVIKNNLVKQVCGSVKWLDTMNQLSNIGVTELVEIGPGRVLSNLAKKSGHDFIIHNISNLKEMDKFIESL